MHNTIKYINLLDACVHIILALVILAMQRCKI